MIRARLIEKHKVTAQGSPNSRIEKVIHEERFFSSKDTFYEWYETVKNLLWENDPTKVDLVEGVYVVTEEVEVDNINSPSPIKPKARYNPKVSYKYAV